MMRLVCRLLGHDYDYDGVRFENPNPPARGYEVTYCARCGEPKYEPDDSGGAE